MVITMAITALATTIATMASTSITVIMGAKEAEDHAIKKSYKLVRSCCRRTNAC